MRSLDTHTPSIYVLLAKIFTVKFKKPNKLKHSSTRAQVSEFWPRRCTHCRTTIPTPTMMIE